MYTKDYWKDLIKKMTILEWIMIVFFLFFIMFFSIFDIVQQKICLSSNWTYSWLTIIGQIFIMISGIFATLTVMNRMHRFKQEMPFLLLGAITTGIGLIFEGYSHWITSNGAEGTLTMAPGIIQLFIFGMSALGGLSHFSKSETNVIPAKKKFLSMELIIAISVVLITLIPFYMLFAKLLANNNQVGGEAINSIAWIGILAFSFSSAAIIVMTLFRWTWTFIFWNIANILFVIYYIEINALAVAAICMLFTTITFYILFKWLKDQKHHKS